MFGNTKKLTHKTKKLTPQHTLKIHPEGVIHWESPKGQVWWQFYLKNKNKFV
jgi:Ni,Fe-hydrogenase III large subunit